MAGLSLAILACVPCAVVLLTVKLAQAGSSVTASDRAAFAAHPQLRRTAGWRWAGLFGGLVAGGVVAGLGGLGRGLLVAAPVFGLGVLAGVVAGEISVRAPGGRTRIAALEVRRVRDYLPRGLARAVLAAASLLLALLVLTTATGAADDLGRSGRIMVLQCGAGLRQGAGPWPGSFYSTPLAAMAAGGLIAAAAALRVVVQRPRIGADQAAVMADDALRRRAGQTITAACGILVGLPLAGASLMTAAALLSLSCRPAWLTIAAWGLLALVPAVLGLAGWCAALLVSPARWFPDMLRPT
jgi:hypothetical protein